jgi:hypothetical protein
VVLCEMAFAEQNESPRRTAGFHIRVRRGPSLDGGRRFLC